MTAFQADDAGSIPAPRSSLFSVYEIKVVYKFWKLEAVGRYHVH